MSESLRDKSRHNWVNDSNSNENIQLGCLLRIADATEAMSKRHTELMRERDSFERSANSWRDAAHRRDLSIRALKGQIIKLRKQLAAASQQESNNE